jgi:hypothetical protein
MNNNSLTWSEKEELQKELVAKGVTIATIIPEIPAGLYSGKFETQKSKDEGLQPVIAWIPYTSRDNKPMGFFALKANITGESNAKSYNNVNIGITDDLETHLKDSKNLVKDYAFRSKQGRVRTFVSVEM